MSSQQPLITFYDNYKAPLSAGSYRLVLQQTVALEGEQPRHYYRDQRFEVLAPRYSIEADDIQAFFPPDGGTADYNNVLPHLVLGSRNLPWERVLSSGNEPWLALLVLSESDMLDGNVVARRGTVADLVPHRPDDLPVTDELPAPWLNTDPDGAVLVPVPADRVNARFFARNAYLRPLSRLVRRPLPVRVRRVRRERHERADVAGGGRRLRRRRGAARGGPARAGRSDR